MWSLVQQSRYYWSLKLPPSANTKIGQVGGKALAAAFSQITTLIKLNVSRFFNSVPHCKAAYIRHRLQDRADAVITMCEAVKCKPMVMGLCIDGMRL